MAAKRILLVSLLVGLGMYAYEDAVVYADSIDEQKTDQLVQELSEKQAQRDEAAFVSDLRQALDAKDAKPALTQLSYELSDPDFPTPLYTGQQHDEAAFVSDLRQALDASDAKATLPQLSSELSDPDFPYAAPMPKP